jgi:uracil-DNA glycosylase
MTSRTELERLLAEVAACAVCTPHLPLGPRPILQIGPGARLLIVGQAPGRTVHQRGIAFDDRTGDALRPGSA